MLPSRVPSAPASPSTFSWTSKYFGRMDDSSTEAGRERWRAAYDKAPKTARDTTNISGNETEPVYGPPPGAVVPGFENIGWPGEYPFTRGLYPTGYRGRPWTIRPFAGFGS